MKVIGLSTTLLAENPVVMASTIPLGEVFSGRMLESISGEQPNGPFLKIQGHVVDLLTYRVYGAGANSTTRFIDYKPHSGSYLKIVN